jgi:nucleoside-diphosphate-sugar epimerase
MPPDRPRQPHRPRVIAIKGATGFLGSQLARRLVAAGCGVVVLKRSFSDTRRIADLLASGTVTHDIDVRPLATPFLEHPIDCVLHCATDYGRRESTSAAIIEANLLLPLQLLELAVEHRVPCFINTDTKLDKRINAYSLSKRQFREWLATFADATTAVNVPLEHFYGPGDDRTKFVSSMIGRMLSPDRSIALTGGEQLRDFIHVDDVVEAFVRIVERCVLEARPPAPTAGGVLTFEIGSGSPVSVRDFMLLLRRLADRPDVALDFGALPYRPNETMRSAADVAMITALGWTPRVGLEDGLRRTLAAERRQRDEVQACAT